MAAKLRLVKPPATNTPEHGPVERVPCWAPGCGKAPGEHDCSGCTITPIRCHRSECRTVVYVEHPLPPDKRVVRCSIHGGTVRV